MLGVDIGLVFQRDDEVFQPFAVFAPGWVSQL